MNGTVQLGMNDWTEVSDVRMTGETMSEHDATLAALTRRYRGRGFVQAARTHQDHMDAMEEEARAIAPAHYRWDELCANGRGDHFRHASYLGRQVMDVDDFASYFSECRASRRAQGDGKVASAAVKDNYVPARTREQSRIARLTGTSSVAALRKQTDRADRVIALAKEWLRPDDPALRREGERRRMPISVISLFVVIAISLMLIVSSSVMVANAKREVSELDDEVTRLEREAQLVTDKLQSHIDYLEIYRVATEEYGMIPAAYVESVYLEAQPENRIEVVQNEEDPTSGLTTLLSAIGIHIGS